MQARTAKNRGLVTSVGANTAGASFGRGPRDRSRDPDPPGRSILVEHEKAGTRPSSGLHVRLAHRELGHRNLFEAIPELLFDDAAQLLGERRIGLEASPRRSALVLDVRRIE